MGELDLGVVDEVVSRHRRRPAAAIAILQALQERFHYLPAPALERVAATTDITPSTLTGIATFYTQFRLQPAGAHRIKVCVGTACHVQGADAVHSAFLDQLGIGDGDDTDGERRFTVERVACLGCCMLAPAVQIDQVTYGHLAPETVPEVISSFCASCTPRPRRWSPPANGAVIGSELRLCCCSSCSASGARDLWQALADEIAHRRLPIRLREVACTGMAFSAPLVEVVTPNRRSRRFARVQPDDAVTLLARHCPPPSPLRRLSLTFDSVVHRLLTGRDGAGVAAPVNGFEQNQRRLVTEGAGQLPPLDVEAYRRAGGLLALRRALELGPDGVLTALEHSGLRGRGGAGFPTARKWRAVRAASGDPLILCNGDEGDPGAFMDRMILESFPLRVLEGMAIAALTVGARCGFLYVRAEYPLALERVRDALELLTRARVLGSDVLGSGRSLHLDVVAGAGAFVCGEETALIAAIEGRRGTPRPRPPFPSERGLRNRPTLVNNVETYASIPPVLADDGATLARLGTTSSRGTKTFALAGKVRRSGLIEVPMGTTLRDIVDAYGGGVPGGQRLKAVQVGGPSGGCVPAALAGTSVDYEALSGVGAMMGSGGLVVLDESDCMVDIARYFMAFTQSESCGNCTFCRVGTRRMLEILERLCAGRGRHRDLDTLEELARAVQRGSLCGLGRSAPNPVLSTLGHFRDEYEAHLDGRCPAGRCNALIHYRITDTCTGCTRCAQVCPVAAIEARPYERHSIDAERCTRCGSCLRVCPERAIEVTS